MREAEEAAWNVIVVRQPCGHRHHGLEGVERHGQPRREPAREEHQPTPDVPGAGHEASLRVRDIVSR